LNARNYDIRNARIVAAKNAAPEWYVPDDEDTKNAHREFVRLPRHDHNALLGFVRKYGFLGIDTDEGPRASTLFGPEYMKIGERLDDLWREWGRLRLFAQSEADKDPRNLLFNKYSPAHMSVRLEEEYGHTVLRVTPNSLIAWMWLRFAQEKAKGYEVRKCALPECPKTREIGHDATKRWKYCSPEHRALDYYRVHSVAAEPKATEKSKQVKRGSK
jgi:hypothetical protein